MATLLLKLEKQLLTKQNEEVIASGDSNVDSCEFEFDSYWDGYTKTAVFYQNKADVSYAILDANNKCVIPSKAMATEGIMYIGVFGLKGINILTSSVVKMEILEGATSGIEIDVEPSDDIFMAIVSQYQAIAEQMTLHNTKATELESGVTTLNKNVISKLAAQDQILEELKAFDVIEVTKSVSDVKEDNATINEKLDAIELSSFTFPNVSIAFVDKAFRITDARVTTKSLVDVYFDSSSFSNAVTANITVESFSGYILFQCEKAPTYSLAASVVVRSVES